MKITKVAVKNFKCLGPNEISINWNDILILVGENNVGKSSFLQALYQFFAKDKTLNSKCFRDIQTATQGAGPIEITVHFSDLTPEEKLQRGLKNRLSSNGDWVLKKVFEYAGKERSESVKYFTFNKRKKVAGISEESLWGQVVRRFNNLDVARGKGDRSKVGDDMDILVEELLVKFPQDVETDSREGWDPNPGGIQSNIDSFFQNNSQYVFIRAVHDARDESEGNKSSFSQLFDLLVKDEIINSKQMLDFNDALTGIINLYKKDATGNRELKAISSIEKDLSEKISRIISAATNIDTNELNQEDISRSVLPIPKISIDDGYPTSVEDQGNGLQRCLILALLQTLAEQKTKNVTTGPKNILIIEEPELYLHPHMERKMRDTLYNIARKDGFQVICTTHSPIFLDMADNHRSIVIFEKNQNREIVSKQVEEEIFTGSSQEEQRNRLRMVLNFDPSVNEVFFAKRIVLVEGDSEIAVFTKSAQTLGLTGDEIRDTTLVNCRGKRTIPAFMRVLNHFGKPYFVLHDKDGNDTFNRVISQLANEKRLGETKLIVDTLEDILGLTESEKKQKDKPIRALQLVNNLHEQNKLKEKLGEYVEFVYDVHLFSDQVHKVTP